MQAKICDSATFVMTEQNSVALIEVAWGDDEPVPVLGIELRQGLFHQRDLYQ